MSEIRISVIVPTIGRATLQAAIDSCAGADEIIVIFDDVDSVVLTTPDGSRVVTGEVCGGDRGYTARTHGIALATGTHLAFLDDDDVFTEDALDVMREHACDRPVIFRMDASTRGLGVLWRDPAVRYCNVGTPMFLIPNDPARLGEWRAHEDDHGGDFTFIKGCIQRMGDPVFVDHVTCVVRPRPTVTIVTPWWNHQELADGYLHAISGCGAHEVLVVDNASDPAIDFAAIRCDDNMGFGRACNIGLSEATGDAVLFLNNDIELIRHDWLDRIVDQLEPGVLVGANLRTDQHTEVDGVLYPYLDGWCLAGMRDDLEQLGGFDERYEEPAYYGDNDLCLRARAAGMRLREATVGLRHLVGQTATPSPEKQRITQANYERYAAAVRTITQGVKA